jgi:hypothetical protein
MHVDEREALVGQWGVVEQIELQLGQRTAK